MHQLEWKPIAEEDLANILDFIAEDSHVSAERFAADIRAKVEKLQVHPELFRVGRKRGTREMVVHPNYILIYRVLTAKVVILRVKHTAQQWP